MPAFVLRPEVIRDIFPLTLSSGGAAQGRPKRRLKSTTPKERASFGHSHGIYGFATQELVGNDTVHEGKSIWTRPHIKERNPFFFSRSMRPERIFWPEGAGGPQRKAPSR